MNRAFDWHQFQRMPLVGILRHEGPLDLAGFVDALVGAGLTTIEVSFTFPDAAEHLSRLVAVSADRLQVGAGTITTLDRLEKAKAAGASFIVTPALVPEVLTRCVAEKLPIFPGAYTPSEIIAAHQAGASVVKLFPAVSLGPAFVKQLKAAVPEVRLLPTGGIELADIPAWKRAGAEGLGLGGGLFPTKFVQAGKWSDLQNHVSQYVAAWRSPSFPSPS